MDEARSPSYPRTVGFFFRKLAPKPVKKVRRSVGRAANPLATMSPKPIKKIRRSAHKLTNPIEAAAYATERQLRRGGRKRGRRTAADPPQRAVKERSQTASSPAVTRLEKVEATHDAILASLLFRLLPPYPKLRASDPGWAKCMCGFLSLAMAGIYFWFSLVKTRRGEKLNTYEKIPLLYGLFVLAAWMSPILAFTGWRRHRAGLPLRSLEKALIADLSIVCLWFGGFFVPAMWRLTSRQIVSVAAMF